MHKNISRLRGRRQRACLQCPSVFADSDIVADEDARANAGVRQVRRAADRIAGREARGRLLDRELKRMGAKPLPGMTDFRMPFTFTAGSKDGGSTFTITSDETAARRRPFAAAAPACWRCRSPTAARGQRRRGVRRLRPRRPRTRRTSATTATRASTSRTRSSSCCATSPRTPIRRRARSSRATPTCATRRRRRGSAAPRA